MTITPSPSMYVPDTLIGGKRGTTFYAIVVIVGCIMYGVVLISLRDASDSLPSMKITKVCASLSLFRSSLTSVLAYVSTLSVDRTSELTGLGAVDTVGHEILLSS